MDYKQLFFILALGFLIPSLIIPWASSDFIGESHSYTPLKITKGLLVEDKSNSVFNLVKLIKPYKMSYYAMILSMTLYFSSFYLLYRAHDKKSDKLLIFAAVFILLSVGLYTFSIENYKSGFSSIANQTGGIIGEEFRGDERSVINNIIKYGDGHKIALIAGIFSLLSYLRNPENHTPCPKGTL
jgi:hypothetical protein